MPKPTETRSAEFTALERELTAAGRDEELVSALIEHAALMLREPDLESRELALRKALRAREVGNVLSREVQLATLRIHVAALRRLPGREGQAQELAPRLVDWLEQAGGETRRERAELLVYLGGLRLGYREPEEGPLTRSRSAATEASWRQALALYFDAGAVDDAVDLAWNLASVIEDRRGHRELDELGAELARTAPREAADHMRALGTSTSDGRVSLPVSPRARAIFARTAEAIASRTREPPPRRTIDRGMRVRHATFGTGIALAAPSGAHGIVEVKFDDGTVKKLTAAVLQLVSSSTV